MITFLPSPDFETSARLLDDKRLGAQRYEAWSILKWLRLPEEYPKLVRAGYCRMWEGYETALVRYTNAMLREWARRGKNNKELRPEDPERGLEEENGDSGGNAVLMPPWMGCEELHSYHRHALIAKLPEHYGEFGWAETGQKYNGSYPWPICLESKDDANGKEGTWILRWPKSVGLDPVPIILAGDSKHNHAASSASKELRSLRACRKASLPLQGTKKTMKKVTKAKEKKAKTKKVNREGKKKGTKVSADVPLRRS
eukprot:CAMPEP_0197464162 /NCGR_PEP_ID=MMETSP1175-20131217/63770_1 /TAXON_ID=1003142 /ORGANISM="Triceratium dubium, Strain CCMP147" /LENGTH=255 /DNA_ID=CAMNT_0043000107 /DNA_START=260 /DNA_END=1023 /DNA_ORIENTATION=-